MSYIEFVFFLCVMRKKARIMFHILIDMLYIRLKTKTVKENFIAKRCIVWFTFY